ncbi:MAG: hypothetical protein COY58_05735 [Gammaproteobacteria bacterium CG_4_10_14_0_8_um_filter_38_16]|nr:MAG: hypothetical protein COY58_05735 [Gammaproteobacteria bacterium CG_4_10_14_0_8_um_filter_38_16]PJA04391.1 MAG: hypothetical protein COX72_00345 [Gammaproteobacteria bacterium CG_4_10_14_0_2_um_filter_38_22]PJB10188.1 MAG: hypothetical protein CO120_06235 [Gammaproteobacteria bacterium CG_4_9_14_3_um_filter_38_9]
MKKINLIFLNIVCFFFLGFSFFLLYQYNLGVLSKTPSDFSSFYVSLKKNDVYKTYSYFKMERQTDDVWRLNRDPASQGQFVNLNTPSMNLILKGWMNLSEHEDITTLIWTSATMLGALLGCFFLMPILWPSKKYILYGLPFFLLIWFSWPSFYNLKIGQITYFIFPVLCCAFYLMHIKKYTLFSIVLGLLASLKLFFLLFLFSFLLRRQWKLGFLFLLSFALFFCIPLSFFSIHSYQLFFNIMQDQKPILMRSILAGNGSFLGFVSNLVYFFSPYATAAAIYFSAFFLCLYTLIRWAVDDYRVVRHLPAFSDELLFSFVIIIALFCSPLSWMYYFIFLTIPVIVIFNIMKRYSVSPWLHLFLFFTFIFSWLATVSGLKNQVFLMIHQFSAFLCLVSFLICLNLAKKAILNGKKTTSLKRQSFLFIQLCVFYAVMSLIFLMINFKDTCFFRTEKICQQLQNKRVIWILNHDQKK